MLFPIDISPREPGALEAGLILQGSTVSQTAGQRPNGCNHSVHLPIGHSVCSVQATETADPVHSRVFRGKAVTQAFTQTNICTHAHTDIHTKDKPHKYISHTHWHRRHKCRISFEIIETQEEVWPSFQQSQEARKNVNTPLNRSQRTAHTHTHTHTLTQKIIFHAFPNAVFFFGLTCNTLYSSNGSTL